MTIKEILCTSAIACFSLSVLFNDALNSYYCMTSVIDERMSVEQLWNDSERRKQTCSDRVMSQGHFPRNSTHTNWPDIDPWPPQ